MGFGLGFWFRVFGFWFLGFGFWVLGLWGFGALGLWGFGALGLWVLVWGLAFICGWARAGFRVSV